MSNLPTDISPESAIWLRLQMTLAAARAVEPLRAEIQELETFVNGLLVAVAQVMPAILATQPTVAAILAPQWRRAAQRYEALSEGAIPLPDDDPLPQLEARQLLYRLCDERGLWQGAPAANGPHGPRPGDQAGRTLTRMA